MDVYVYLAGLHCRDCGESIRETLDRSGLAPADPEDKLSYVSDDYPKGPYPDGGGEADCPQHCESGDDCLNAIELSDGSKIGCWLGNELTTDGVEYVKEAIERGGEVAELWADYYREFLD